MPEPVESDEPPVVPLAPVDPEDPETPLPLMSEGWLRLEPLTPAAPEVCPACHSEAESWPSRLVSSWSKRALRSDEPWASLLEITPSPLVSTVPNWERAPEVVPWLAPELPMLPALPLTSLPTAGPWVPVLGLLLLPGAVPLWLLLEPVPTPP